MTLFTCHAGGLQFRSYITAHEVRLYNSLESPLWLASVYLAILPPQGINLFSAGVSLISRRAARRAFIS